MKVVREVICHTLLLVNCGVGVLFLICAYSPYIHPTTHSLWACAGLFFPIFLTLNLLFLCFWFVVKKKYALLPLLLLLVAWKPCRTYCPINLPIAAKTADSTVIKLLTYNTMGIPLEKDTEGREVNPITHYLAHSGADIICLQEYPLGRHKQICKELEVNYPYARTLRFSNGNGVACYSKFRILDARPISYASRFNGSGLFHLQMGKDTVVVINNHLESNKLDSHDKAAYKDMLTRPGEQTMKQNGRHLLHKLAEAVAIRATEADSVAHVIAQTHTPYLLVCGDLNDSPLSYTHRVIGRGLQDVYVAAGNGPGFTYNRNALYFRIDHIFAGKGFKPLKCEVDRSIRTSDHYPVWCLLRK